MPDVHTRRRGLAPAALAAAVTLVPDPVAAAVSLAASVTADPIVVTVPEPTTSLLLATGVLGMAAAARRRRRESESDE